MGEVIKQIKIRLLVAIVFLAVVAIFYGFNNNNITGNFVIAPIINNPDNGCNYSGAIYNGTFMKVLSPLNNSYTGKNNFNITILTDYAGSDIITQCPEEEPTECSMKLVFAMYNLESKTIDIPTIVLPKVYSGNKTYTYLNASSDTNYNDGNFTLKIVAQYSCRSEEYAREDLQVKVHLEQPTITQIYPTNNLQINISSNATTTISPKLIATDALGIKNKTVNDGTKIISLLDNPNYNVTLSPGTYNWSFIATDLAGNTQTIISQFQIFNSTTNATQIEIIPNQTNITTPSNVTLFFDPTTTKNNELTNSSIVYIKINADTQEEANITINIFDETGKIIYQNTTSEKTLEVTHNFISDGTYYYNATVTSGETQTNTETRKVIIDTESPSIEINSPTKGQNTFTGSVLIDFTADDTNGISKLWINDGKKNTEYTKKINKTLEEGNYTWSIYAQDKAGNIAQETIKFAIVTETEQKSSKKIAIVIIIIAVVLMILLIAYYFLRKKPEGDSNSNNQKTNMMPPSNPTYGMPTQQNRPIQPILSRNSLPPMQNQVTFKNNQFSR